MEENIMLELNSIIDEAAGSKYSLDQAFLSIIVNEYSCKNIMTLTDYKYLIDDKIEFNQLMHIEGKYLERATDIIWNTKLGELSSIAEIFLNSKKKEITGSYYTPIYIVEFMINNSLENYIIEKLNVNKEIITRIIYDEVVNSLEENIANKVLNILENIRIIDIACGSGLFLIHMFQKLYKLRLALNGFLGKDVDEYNIKKEILKNNVFGIDIQSFPLQVFILSLIKDLSKYDNFNLRDLKFNVYQKNSILGEEIFKIREINLVIEQKGFDIVIGNPPYIGEKGNREIFTEVKKYSFGAKYYEGKMDYFYYFIYRGLELLKEKGILTYITTNYFITADGANKLRKYLKNNVSFKTIVNFNECEIFKYAKGQHNMIFTTIKEARINCEIDIKYFNNGKYKKDQIESLLLDGFDKSKGFTNYKIKSQREIYSNNGNIIVFPNEGYGSIIKKIEKQSDHFLGEICYINQGIVSGADKITKNMIETKLNNYDFNKFEYSIGEGIFVLNEEEIYLKDLEGCRVLKPFYKNSDIKKYFTSSNTNRYILYMTDENVLDDKLCKAIQRHLCKFKTILSMRRETHRGTRKWYALQWYRENKMFETEKIVVPHRALRNNFGYNRIPWFASADVYFITRKDEKTNLKLLLGLLNSKLVYFWLFNMGKRKGNYLELYSKPLSQIPLKINISKDIQNEIINQVEKILSITKNDHRLVQHHQEIIDKYLYSIYGFSDDEINLISNSYDQFC